jgi:hypothetical protein
MDNLLYNTNEKATPVKKGVVSVFLPPIHNAPLQLLYHFFIRLTKHIKSVQNKKPFRKPTK